MAIASASRFNLLPDSTSQLRATSFEQHMSTLGHAGLIGAGTRGTGTSSYTSFVGMPRQDAKASVPMSAAVLEAAKRVAEELQSLQDEYLTSNYSGDRPPPRSRFITQSWGQMSVLNTLMEQMEDERRTEAAIKRRGPWRGVHAQAEALAEEAEMRLLKASSLDKDWRKVLKDNKKSEARSAMRRAELLDKRHAAATIIQKCWKQHRFYRMVARIAMRNREARRKSDSMYTTTEAYEDRKLRGSKLHFTPTDMVTKIRRQDERRQGRTAHGSPLADIHQLAPGTPPPGMKALQPRMAGSNASNHLAPLAPSSPSSTAIGRTKGPESAGANKSVKNRAPAAKTATTIRAEALHQVALENIRSKSCSPAPYAKSTFRSGPGYSKRNTPEPLEKIPSPIPCNTDDKPEALKLTTRKSLENRYMRQSKRKIAPLPLSNSPSPIPFQHRLDEPRVNDVDLRSPSSLAGRSPSPWESADDFSKVLSVGMVKKTGLWRKVRAPVAMASAMKQRNEQGAPEVSQTSLNPANGKRWKSVVYRANRINAVAASFLEFDKVLSKWTKENEDLLGSIGKQSCAMPDVASKEKSMSKNHGEIDRKMDDEAAQAGHFLVTASAIWRIMRSNLLHAKADILLQKPNKNHVDTAATVTLPTLPAASISALESVASLSEEDRTSIHHHLGKEIQPISVALGRVHQPLVMIQRSVRQARRARDRVKEKSKKQAALAQS